LLTNLTMNQSQLTDEQQAELVEMLALAKTTELQAQKISETLAEIDQRNQERLRRSKQVAG
jgi:hypothetical protein